MYYVIQVSVLGYTSECTRLYKLVCVIHLIGFWAYSQHDIVMRVDGYPVVVPRYMARVVVIVQSVKCGVPNQRLVARMVNYHLNGQCTVDIYEEGVCLISVEPRGIHLCQGINECCKILVLAASIDNMW